MMEFTPSQMAVHLMKLAAALPMATHEALEQAAALVLKQAQSEPGEYQSGAGPFASWAPLAVSTLADKARKGLPSPSPELRTGELRDSYEKTVGAREAQVGSNSDIAVWQELGTSKMPPRSIVGLAGAKKENEIHEITGRLFYGLLTSGSTKIKVGEGS
jgi:hypothetical protein